jgi:hypothetical protein
MTEAALRYRADITAGALKLPETRVIADLLLSHTDPKGWNEAILTKNVLQARNPATARRLTQLIRGRLELMGPDLWALVRDASGEVATQAVFASAVKQSRLLGDFLQIVVAEQYRLFSITLSDKLWDEYLQGCRERDNKQTHYRLVLRDVESGIEQQSVQVIIDRAFTNDF